ncbi:hypothetical protein [Mesorhizobium sp. A556]
MSETAKLTPSDVESMIDQAGRDKVFARAETLGWNGGTPPLWVWAGICRELEQEASFAEPNERKEPHPGSRLIVMTNREGANQPGVLNWLLGF